MKKINTHTSFKVVTGYILLFIVTLLAVIFIYKQILRLTGDEGAGIPSNQKLYIISNTITTLYEAEALSNSFLQTGSGKDFQKYLLLMDETGSNIDSLKKLIQDPQQQLRLDTIQLLLKDKMKNLKDLIQVKQTYSPQDFYQEAIHLIESQRDSLNETPNIHKKTITTLDSTYVKTGKKRKGFLGIFGPKLPDSTLQVTVKKYIITDTLEPTGIDNNTDTIVNILRSVWENLQKETQNVNRQISQQGYKIVQKSTNITKELKTVLNELEREEINHSVNRMKQQQQVLNTTTSLIAKIAIIAFLIILFFIFLILKDLSKSQRYRKELEAAKQYTDELLKIREKFMLTVSHDIKSPLSSVLGYIELLCNTPVNERQKYYLKNMKGSATHILQLVTNLLDFTKLENNKLQPENVPFNPALLLQEVNDSFIPQAQKKKLRLKSQIEEELNAEYEGDALRIRQIIVNILSNAIKYTDSGEVNLSAGFSRADSRMLIKIQDTGPGMNPEETAFIFKEFTRLSSSSSVEGTGLGLPITQKLIQMLGGELQVESEPGKGSCFIIYLPLTRSTKQQEFLSAHLSGLKILMLDDDPLQLEMTQNLLKSKGIHSETTTSPLEALKKIESADYDLIFTDIQMPHLNGWEIIKRIREIDNEKKRHIPVIAISGVQEDKNTYLQAGFSDYLNKPFTPEQLFRIILKTRHISGEIPVVPPILKKEAVSKSYTLKNIQMFTEGDEEALKKIITSFVNETELHLQFLEDILLKGNYENASSLAHKMLPLFRQLEAREIIPLLEKVEHPGNLRDEEKKEGIREIVRLCKDLLTEIKSAENYSIE